jgi:hypothetical protein
MKCEEIQGILLNLNRDRGIDPRERAAALAHVGTCSRCAALQESWQAAGVELRALADMTWDAQAPSRVEMRLRQEFRTKHRTVPARRAAVLAAWALATAAVLVGVVSWKNWQKSQHGETARHAAMPAKTGSGTSAVETATIKTDPSVSDAILFADNDGGEFTLLPGSVPAETDDAAIVRVRMERGALGALGLPVNEERAGEWIQVDLLVGQDGQPQAVRLPQ